MQNFKPKTLHLEEEGVAKVLGQLESKVMSLIWERGKSTVREVRDSLANTYKELSFNSIMTIMNRLTDKGLLAKQKKDQVYKYESTTSESDFIKTIVENILDSLLRDQSLTSSLKPEALGQLKNLLN